MKCKWLTIILPLALQACVTAGYKNLGYDNKDASYVSTTMNFSMFGDGSGRCQVQVKTRAYEISGKTAVCGYLYSGPVEGCLSHSHSSEELVLLWFREGTLYFYGDKVSSSSFLEFKDYAGRVPCIGTNVQWQSEFDRAKPLVKGDFVWSH